MGFSGLSLYVFHLSDSGKDSCPFAFILARQRNKAAVEINPGIKKAL